MKCRLAVVDARCGETIVERLHEYAEEVFLFCSENVTYESVSCHPDIFLYQDSRSLVLAPNAPKALLEALSAHSVPFVVGKSEVGFTLSDSCYYNCVATEQTFFHRKGFTDEVVGRMNAEKRFVELPQSYTRCSMLPISEEAFVTSDAGIHRVLLREGFSSFLFSPEKIRIAVHKYGFLGGTCGKMENKLIFMGNPLMHEDGASLCRFVEARGCEIVSLADQYLYDGGGLFFF